MRSPNWDARKGTGVPDMVVIHYTEMESAEAAARWLCNPASRVSAHYVIAADGAVLTLVDEERRAWHAGVSAWEGRPDVNSRSIGIELDHPGHAGGLPPFARQQMTALLTLLDGIRNRWTIPVHNVVAHSDVAPGRKIDPGERFPWEELVEAGHALSIAEPDVEADLLTALRDCGYWVDDIDGKSPTDTALVDALHRRVLPHRVGLPANAETLRAANGFAAAARASRAAYATALVGEPSPEMTDGSGTD